jgi:hypothetical protein
MTKLEKFLEKHPITTYLIFYVLLIIAWRCFGFEQAVIALLAGNIFEIATLGRIIRDQGKDREDHEIQ